MPQIPSPIVLQALLVKCYHHIKHLKTDYFGYILSNSHTQNLFGNDLVQTGVKGCEHVPVREGLTKDVMELHHRKYNINFKCSNFKFDFMSSQPSWNGYYALLNTGLTALLTSTVASKYLKKAHR